MKLGNTKCHAVAIARSGKSEIKIFQYIQNVKWFESSIAHNKIKELGRYSLTPFCGAVELELNIKVCVDFYMQILYLSAIFNYPLDNICIILYVRQNIAE